MLGWNLYDKVIDPTINNKLATSPRGNSVKYYAKSSHSMNAVEHMPHLLERKYVNGTC